MNNLTKSFALLLLTLSLIFSAGFLVPEKPTIPVQNATAKDWHPQSFWFSPWGRSGVHKGIDIFAKKGTPVLASTHGLVISTGKIGMGGNYVLMLGANWRFHYFAHLHSIKTQAFTFKKAGSVIGTVGDSGNAKGKPPHLHWSIKRLVPLPWKADDSIQGYKKAYFINPSTWLQQQ